MRPIRLTDAELDAVFSAARPLDSPLAESFLAGGRPCPAAGLFW